MKDIIKRKLVRTDPAGYEIWSETSRLPTYTAMDMSAPNDAPETPEVSELIEQIEGASGQTITMETAYNPAGQYIGDPETAEFLCVKKGIAPELMGAGKVCSIGFCEKDQKWFGWSHRAIFGFGVGDEVAEGDCCASSGWTDEYLAEHPEADTSLPVGFRATTLDDARRMAVAFAESVG